MEIVKLKNGAEDARSHVASIMFSLKRLFVSDPVAAYELVMKCRDQNHQLCGDAADRLRQLSLVGPNGIHESVRNVVLSAVRGEGCDLALGSPVQQ